MNFYDNIPNFNGPMQGTTTNGMNNPMLPPQTMNNPMMSNPMMNNPMMSNPMMNNNISYKISELENRIKKLELRISRLEADKPNNYAEPDNSLYMI